MAEALTSILMGSISDWPVMEHASKTLDEMGIPHDVRVLSAHRTPEALFEYMDDAEQRGVEVFIAAAGGAAHLAGVVASKTTRPVLAVPMETKLSGGLDSLLSMVQMPAGIPVATFAVGKAGAVNAAIFAASILALHHDRYASVVPDDRRKRAAKVLETGDPRQA
ncbi:MAG: 5-(carboxyamino)imidazole ribonucleotide mutase [Phycisphaerales bacterium]|nr:5-(carboxyamino)imidazole ribonucleotide mutase [Phycisphaerales bacterium]